MVKHYCSVIIPDEGFKVEHAICKADGWELPWSVCDSFVANLVPETGMFVPEGTELANRYRQLSHISRAFEIKPMLTLGLIKPPRGDDPAASTCLHFPRNRYRWFDRDTDPIFLAKNLINHKSPQNFNSFRARPCLLIPWQYIKLSRHSPLKSHRRLAFRLIGPFCARETKLNFDYRTAINTFCC